MGNASKRAAKNIRIVQQHGLAVLVINAIFILWRLYRNRATASWGHYASLLPTSAVYGVSYRLLKSQAEDGSELFQKGLVEYCWDMVWITMFVQLLACYTDWAWVLYSIVRLRACLCCAPHLPIVAHPAAPPSAPCEQPPSIGSCYGGYMLWTQVIYPWISKVDGEPEGDDVSSKKKLKAERMMRRQKGK